MESPLGIECFILKRRLREPDFFIIRWFRPVVLRSSFPVPVTVKRFAAVLRVLIFGIVHPYVEMSGLNEPGIVTISQNGEMRLRRISAPD